MALPSSNSTDIGTKEGLGRASKSLTPKHTSTPKPRAQPSSGSLDIWMQADSEDSETPTIKSIPTPEPAAQASSNSLDIWMEAGLQEGSKPPTPKNTLTPEPWDQTSSNSLDVWMEAGLEQGSKRLTSTPKIIPAPDAKALASSSSLDVWMEEGLDEGNKTPTPMSVVARNSRASLSSQGSIRRLRSRPSSLLRPNSQHGLERSSMSSLGSKATSKSSIDIWIMR